MNLPVLDVAIGISFVYLLMSLICTTVNEMIASRMKTRAIYLDKGITRLLGGDEALKALIYKHPMIKSLAEKDSAICPSYIPADKFATALLDIISGKDKSLVDFNALKQGLSSISNEHLKGAMTVLLDKSSEDALTARRHVENWFDENMDRVSGWYKRNTQRTAMIIGVSLTLVMNADTVHMASLLWVTPTMREAVVARARIRAEHPEASNGQVEALTADEKSQLSELTGWKPDWASMQTWWGDSSKGTAPWEIILSHLVGWILTAFAVSLGAPFWFDTLNRFMNIRNSGRAPDERRDKSQSAAAAVAVIS